MENASFYWKWYFSFPWETHFLEAYQNAVEGMLKHLVRKTATGWLYLGEIRHGKFSPKMDHLVCFLAGTLALGHINGADPSAATTTRRRATDGKEEVVWLPGRHLELAIELGKTCVHG